MNTFLVFGGLFTHFSVNKVDTRLWLDLLGVGVTGGGGALE